MPGARPHHVGLVWAQAHDRVIGRDGAMPWHLPEDLAHFREVTQGAVVVMGRRTWESLPPRFRPLPGRTNLVLSRHAGLELDGAEVLPDVDAALARAAGRTLWVVGGAQVYEAFLPLADRVELTEIDVRVDGDTRAPHLDDDAWTAATRSPDDGWHVSRTGLRYRFVTLARAGAGAAAGARTGEQGDDAPR